MYNYSLLIVNMQGESQLNGVILIKNYFIG